MHEKLKSNLINVNLQRLCRPLLIPSLPMSECLEGPFNLKNNYHNSSHTNDTLIYQMSLTGYKTAPQNFKVSFLMSLLSQAPDVYHVSVQYRSDKTVAARPLTIEA